VHVEPRVEGQTIEFGSKRAERLLNVSVGIRPERVDGNLHVGESCTTETLDSTAIEISHEMRKWSARERH
jgi:hypothetical protein